MTSASSQGTLVVSMISRGVVDLPVYFSRSPGGVGHNSSYPQGNNIRLNQTTVSRPYHPVATSNIFKKMTDPNLPTMRTRINGLALTLAEKTWAQEELDAHPNLASTWTPETDVNLTAFIKQSATQSAPPGSSSLSGDLKGLIWLCLEAGTSVLIALQEILHQMQVHEDQEEHHSSDELVKSKTTSMELEVSLDSSDMPCPLLDISFTPDQTVRLEKQDGELTRRRSTTPSTY
ncbi:hypothetical protein PROFUN_16145 [Planoprotostelium fungivorum]|uniref:Uncharacterized protein n=1 Tax=Planoprotostelium fungivorum TaxID=1890364 RepID=A0A2P6MSP1_9EUKA|nr:hypothetical protein PROFUN_16145 [Planoprotostelium fungivorum]